jgi:hypothetical protein
LLAVCATAAMVVALRRQSTKPSASTALAALIVGAIGGWDRIDVVSHSQVQSAHADVLTRAAATACLALGGALLVRFLADLVPRALGLGAAGDRGARNVALSGTTASPSTTEGSSPVTPQP